MIRDLLNTSIAATTCCDGEQFNIYSEGGVIVEIQERVKGFTYQSAYAKHLQISPQYLNDILAGYRRISDEVAERLGYKRITVFVKSTDGEATSQNEVSNGRTRKL